MKLAILYTLSGALLFSYLFVKFLRRGASDARRNKWEHFFLHGLDVRRKVWTDPSYLVHFVALMIGLMAFAVSAAWLLQRSLEAFK